MGGRHAPLAPVHRLADFCDLAIELKDAGAQHVAHVVVARDGQSAVVPPFVGIADLVGQGVQLLQRLLLGRRRHPGQAIDVLLHGFFNLLHHFLGALLGLGREGALHVGLAQGFTQIVVRVTHTALPARFELLRPAQGLAEEIEIGVHKCRGEIGRVGM